MPDAVPVDCLVDARCALGESPVWDAAIGRLYWCDILGKAVHGYDLASGRHQVWSQPEVVPCMGLARSGRLLLALTHQVVLFDPKSGQSETLARIENEPEGNRLNDGKVGPDGAFWVGSAHDVPPDAVKPQAALYRITPDGLVEKRIDGLKTSNGLAWSADGRRMFHTDSRGPWIDCWDFDPASGAMSNRRRIRDLTDAEGRPDGGATDIEGAYWSAGVSAGLLNRFSPKGELLGSIPMPVPKPTMPCFGGPDMKTLFVTSHRQGMSAADLERFPQSGSLFRLNAPVAGVPVERFRD